MLDKLENLLKAEIDPAFAERARFIFKEIEKQKPKRILDVGCGRGFYVYASTLYNFPKEIHGIEINKNYLKIAKKNIKDQRVILKEGNLYKLPYKNNYFDANYLF